MTVLVLGNATVDLSYEVERLPLPGETLLARGKLVDAGGKGLNQAVVAHRAGATVRFCTVVGEDAGAAIIRRHLAAEGMDASLLRSSPAATDESLILVAPSGENAIVSTADSARAFSASWAREAIAGLSAGGLMAVQGNLSRATTLAALEAARAASLRTMLNPAPIAFDYAGLWPLVDIAVLNEVEAAQLGACGEVDGAAGRLISAGVACVIVTLGAAGARLYDGMSARAIPAPEVKAVDATGAGDVVCGVLAAGVSQGLDIRAALGWAVAAASLSVTRRGTGAAFPTRAELASLREAALATAGAA